MNHLPARKELRPMAVMVGEFPSLSETFILRELEVLHAAGLAPSLYALRKGRSAITHQDAMAWIPRTNYLPHSTSCASVAQAWLQLRRHDRVGAGRMLKEMLKAGRRFPVMFARMIRHLPSIAALGRDVCDHKFGYLHAHFATLPAEVAWAASVYGACPYGFSTHARDIFTQSPALLRYKIAGAELVTACTETHGLFLKNLATEASRSRIEVFYHGVPVPETDAAHTVTDCQAGILAVGRLVPKKAFDTLIDACAILTRKGVGYTCDIVGEGPEEHALQYRIRDAGLEDQVRLQGGATQEQMPRLYSRSTVAVVASRIMPDGDRDGIPNVLLEAMAMGLPVIAADTPSIREVIRHDYNGCLIPVNNVARLAAMLERLLDNPKLRADLGKQAALTIRERFNAKVHAGQLAGKFRALVSKPITAPA